MNREEILKTLNELKPLIKAENDATNNWNNRMHTVWRNPLIRLARELNVDTVIIPKKNVDGTNNWDIIETVGVGDITIKVED